MVTEGVVYITCLQGSEVIRKQCTLYAQDVMYSRNRSVINNARALLPYPLHNSRIMYRLTSHYLNLIGWLVVFKNFPVVSCRTAKTRGLQDNTT